MCRCNDGKPIKHACKKDYVWNSSICACEFVEHLKRIFGGLVITCDEFKDILETISITFNDKKAR